MEPYSQSNVVHNRKNLRSRFTETFQHNLAISDKRHQAPSPLIRYSADLSILARRETNNLRDGSSSSSCCRWLERSSRREGEGNCFTGLDAATLASRKPWYISSSNQPPILIFSTLPLTLILVFRKRIWSWRSRRGERKRWRSRRRRRKRWRSWRRRRRRGRRWRWRRRNRRREGSEMESIEDDVDGGGGVVVGQVQGANYVHFPVFWTHHRSHDLYLLFSRLLPHPPLRSSSSFSPQVLIAILVGLWLGCLRVLLSRREKMMKLRKWGTFPAIANFILSNTSNERNRLIFSKANTETCFVEQDPGLTTARLC